MLSKNLLRLAKPHSSWLITIIMKNQHLLTLPFSEIRKENLPLVGGKGANLGEMTHTGFPIPNGFCVTTIAFEQFMDVYADVEDLYAQLETVSADVEKVRRIGSHIRKTLLAVRMPSAIANAIRLAWQAMGMDKAYAVRSSATTEDLSDASFAGQQDTYLNIIGENALLDAVHRCWVSLFTDRAILYRVQNNFPHRNVKLSVIVQQMVMSEKSGILFTADPLTGHRHTASIDASFGLGEALVSGLVSPDAYRVDKRNMEIIERQISEKKFAIYSEKAGDILVAPFTDPGWTPLFINAGGLITEVGGAMTHGSIVAREYGIPAIVGVQNATNVLQSGQRVRVNGNRGVIEIL